MVKLKIHMPVSMYASAIISVVKKYFLLFIFCSHLPCLHIFHPICGHYFIHLMSAFKFIISNHGNVNKFVQTVSLLIT